MDKEHNYKCIDCGKTYYSFSIRGCPYCEENTDEHRAYVATRNMELSRLEMQKALATQIGGSHYKSLSIQPVEFIIKNKLTFLEGCIIKRICRHRSKNGREDLLKAKHEIDLLLELEYPTPE